ncbi:MAG: LacI family DNA-binding transcriptional regulator [Chloroflexi bacterium]|nr:LacI family DNA-binding transcriptional regulator [Chloroflexota bacterium]
MHATIVDVAREAGVSPTTVSHVINGTRHVAESTKQRVQAAIAHLDYEVNSLAQSLKCDRSQTIGLMLADISNPFFTSLARGVEDVANAAGYSVVLCSTDEDSEKELTYLRMLRRKRVDGILLAPTGTRQPLVDELIKAGFPLVCFDRQPLGVPCDTVLVDNVGGARRAVSHLVELGHRRIGTITGLAGIGTTDERIAGYRHAIADRGLPIDPDLIREGNSRLDGGFREMLALLDLPMPPTAIFSTNNLMTLGALAALQSRQVRVPDDVAIVGFDDFEWAAVLRPRLTSVAQPTYEIGAVAARMAIERIGGGGGSQPRQVILPSRLIVRESCGAARQFHPSGLDDVLTRVPGYTAGVPTPAR